MIRTQAELIQVMQDNPKAKLFWSMGSRPSESGSYDLHLESGPVTVHGNAAKALIIRKVVYATTTSWQFIAYRLSERSDATKKY